MSGFVATADAAPPTPEADTIENNGFFPDVSIAALRAGTKLDGTVNFDRIRAAAVDAMRSVNAELVTWRAEKAAGYDKLAAIPADRIGGDSVLVSLYLRAVYNLAHADVTERYRDFDATKSGGQEAERLEETICTARRNARWALNDLRGIPRSTIELI
ncbi:head completion/stabilization protein [Burkholderia gladioli]|uniref:head completion/stabilization protein n=1 Tax=Burkholderia gladioli TaxID=28095 RepID=UPI000CFF70CC|nr:head completion/stabilization protein [Burkholderia gladioli]MBU9155073.1 head completion/stabilization protein [Burkholderia gladioli]PRG48123.1 phage head protein [Burkholderia gladioli]